MNNDPNTAAQVLFAPGQEPEAIRQRIQRLKEKLDSAYPDKVIFRLYHDHKKWGEAVTQLYRLLGYPNGKAFLTAYGYTVRDDKGGHPVGDHMAIINELKKRYVGGPNCCTLNELKAANPDLAPKFKNLGNQASELFGMTLAKYLQQEGILASGTQRQELAAAKAQERAASQKQQALETAPGELEKLRQRYQDAPYDGEEPIVRFWAKNFDINREALRLYAEEQGLMVQTLLQREGIIESQQQVLARKERQLNDMVAVLQSRYPEGSVLPESAAQLKRENSDLELAELDNWIMSVHKKRANDYLLSRGLLMDLDSGSLSERMAKMSAILQKRYASAGVKPSTICAVRRDSPDLPFKDFWQWTRDGQGKGSTEYLLELGVLDMAPDKLWEYECFRYWARAAADNFNYPDELPCEGKRVFVTGRHAAPEEREQMARRIQALGGRVGGETLTELDWIVGVHPGKEPWARRLELGERQLWVINSAMADLLLNKEGGKDNG